MGSSRMVWEPDQRLSLHGIRVQDPPGEPGEAAVTDPGWAELGPHPSAQGEEWPKVRLLAAHGQQQMAWPAGLWPERKMIGSLG